MAHTDMLIWQTSPILHCLPKHVSHVLAQIKALPRVDIVNTLASEVNGADAISQFWDMLFKAACVRFMPMN